MDKEQQNMKKLLENQQKFLEGRTQTTEEKLQAALWNRIYQFLASDPAFNAIDGTGKNSTYNALYVVFLS